MRKHKSIIKIEITLYSTTIWKDSKIIFKHETGDYFLNKKYEALVFKLIQLEKEIKNYEKQTSK